MSTSTETLLHNVIKWDVSWFFVDDISFNRFTLVYCFFFPAGLSEFLGTSQQTSFTRPVYLFI